MERKFTDSSLFLIPMYGLPMEEFKRAGFIDAYAQDENKMFVENCCLMLFRASEEFGYLQSDLITLFDDLVIDVYSPTEELMVIVLKIPVEFEGDYFLITEGQYSYLSPQYKEKVDNKVWARMQSTNTHTIAKEKRLQLRIIEKDPMIAKMSGMVPNEQVWPMWNTFSETLTNEIINQLSNDDK